MLKLLILLAIASSISSQEHWGPFDPRCPLLDDPMVPWHLPHEYDCTKFYKCFDRQRVLFDCPPGLEWGHLEICKGIWCACEWPWQAQCNPDNLPGLPTDIPPTDFTTTPTGTTPTTDTTPMTTPTPPMRCPEVDDPFNPVFLPHEIFCDQYYLCHRGAKIPRSCAFGLFWDQTNTWCNFPWLVECHHDCPTPDDIDNPVFLPNYSFCDRYFLCFNGTRIPRDCATGLQWSRNGEWCDYYNIIRCGDTGVNKKAQVVGVDEMIKFKFNEEL